MLNKIILIASIAWSFCNAANGSAMIGDFSPMKVGNTWVYSVVNTNTSYESLGATSTTTSEKTIKIVSMTQNGDSLFYTIVDSTVQLNCPNCVPAINTKIFLELNNSNFIYDTSNSSAKTCTPIDSLYTTFALGFPENCFGFCGHHNLPDSILKKVTFLSQKFYLDSLYVSIPIYGEASYKLQWIQNFGLVHYIYGYASDPGSSTQTVDLISFNNQSVPIITSKNVTNTSPINSMVFLDTRYQLHWRELSANDHLNAQLYDCRGKLIYSSHQLPGSFVLNTSRFSCGAYILRYQVNNETWKHFSFVRN